MTYPEIVKRLETICEHLDMPELLAQLAEEAAELGHAALKLRRALTGTNPTPVTPEEAMAQLFEEIGDVYNALEAMECKDGHLFVTTIGINTTKLDRWAERLEQVENG